MKVKFGIMVLIAALWGSGPGQAQPSQPPEVGMPIFNTAVYSTLSPESGQALARVYVQIVNDNLTFLKNDSGFYADLLVEVYLTEIDHDFVLNRTLSKKITTADYAATNSTSMVNTFFTEIPVDPGKYEVAVTLSDKNSNKQFSRKTGFEMPPSSLSEKGLAVSDLMFYNALETDPGGDLGGLHPELTRNFSGQGKAIYAYFTSFSSGEEDSLQIEYFIKDDRGVIIQQNKYDASPGGGFREHYIRLNRYYFNRNAYLFQLAANLGNEAITRASAFSFYWKFAPAKEQDLDQAIEYLKYIAREDSIRYYRKKSYEEKRGFFERFWQARDPNPDTEENELMLEYYRRVNFANNTFSTSGFRGWLSDRGRIYIKFGQPDEVDRHPFEAGSYPYEIWRYYSVNKTFLFIDRSGFGDYELHPSYYYVEYE